MSVAGAHIHCAETRVLYEASFTCLPPDACSSTTNENTGNTKTVNNHDTAAVACDAKLSERSTYTATQLRAACLARLSSHIAPAAGATKYRFIDGLCYGADWIVYEDDPRVTHSTYLVFAVDQKSYVRPAWIVGTNRMASTVNKTAILSVVCCTQDQSSNITPHSTAELHSLDALNAIPALTKLQSPTTVPCSSNAAKQAKSFFAGTDPVTFLRVERWDETTPFRALCDGLTSG